MKTITATELKDRRTRGDKFALINTLSPDSFAKTKIPGAMNIPLEEDDFTRKVEQAVGGKDRPVVVYCASEQCHSSTKAAEQLEQAGFSKVTDFEGGAEAWKQAGESLG